MRRSRLCSQFRPAHAPRCPRTLALATSAVGGVPLRCDVEKILQQPMTVLRCDAFRVELHAMDGKTLVGKPHDQAVLGIGRCNEFLRQASALDHEGMVARGLKRRVEAAEKAPAVMADFR